MTPDALKKLGGKRPGAGRKPKPDKMIGIQTRVPPSLVMWLMIESKRREMGPSEFVRFILLDYMENHQD